MSVWKKVSKINQKEHRERHQPSSRASLGLLEKHKDYVKRASDFHKKEKVIKKLREKALNKNPNEYYHHMVNSQISGDLHVDKLNPDSEHTIEQKLMLQTKNISYVDLKLNIEYNKIEKLKSNLHMIDFTQNKKNGVKSLANDSFLALADIDKKTINKSIAAKDKKYKELVKRLDRHKQLTVIKEKMEVEKNLKSYKQSGISRPKLVSPATKSKAAVYEWKYERKK